jgi:hypothetical protein
MKIGVHRLLCKARESHEFTRRSTAATKEENPQIAQISQTVCFKICAICGSNFFFRKQDSVGM